MRILHQKQQMGFCSLLTDHIHIVLSLVQKNSQKWKQQIRGEIITERKLIKNLIKGCDDF